MSGLPAISREANFSDDGVYRHWLSRDWGLRRFTDGREPYALWVGHNPSTADAERDDPTVRRMIQFTRRLLLSRLFVVNAMDLVATHPRALRSATFPASRLNPVTVHRLAERAAAIVCCWGRVHPDLEDHVVEIQKTLGSSYKLVCLGRNGDGSPRHPLRLAADTPFVPFTFPVRYGGHPPEGAIWSPR